MRFEMEYKKYLLTEKTISDIAEDIVEKINNHLNIKWYIEDLDRGGILPIFETFRHKAGRNTRFDGAVYLNPQMSIGISRENFQYWVSKKYVKAGDFSKFNKIAENIIRKMGQSVKIGGPLKSIKQEAVKIGKFYIIFNGDSFDVVTSGKFKNWINTLDKE